MGKGPCRTTVALALASVLVAGCGPSEPTDLLVSAKEYIAKEDYQSAAIQLKSALGANPSLAEARFLFGQLLFQTGDAPGAEIELRRAKSLGYPADAVDQVLARALLARGEHRKVVDEFSGVQPSKPEDQAVLYTAVGQAHLALNSLRKAQASFDAALAAQPSYAPALLSSAYLKAAHRDKKSAMALVERALESSPKLAEAHQFKGELLAGDGDYDGALASFRKSIETKADYVPGHSAIIRLFVQREEMDQARKQLKTLQKVAPKNPQTVYLSALLSYQEKDLARARETIEGQLIMAPENVPGLVLAGAIELDLRSFAQSEAYLKRALEKTPNHLVARHLLVANYLHSGQAYKAIDAITPILKIADNHQPTLALAGEVYLVNGQADEAVRYFEKSSVLAPEDIRSRTGVGLSYIAQGSADRGYHELEQAAASSKETVADLALIAAYIKDRKVDQALDAIKALEKKRPQEPMVHNLRGVALLAKKDAAGARQSFERAAGLDPAYLPAAENLAKLDLAEGRPQDAKRRYEVVLAKNPKSSRALLALADLRQLANGNTNEITALMRKAVAADPTDALSRIALIDQLVRSKELATAVTTAQEALTAIPDRPELLDAAARAQLASGERNQALASYAKWAQLQPESPIPFLRMAEIQLANGDVASAEKNLRKSLQINPNYLDAQRRLIELNLERDMVPQALALAKTVQKQRPDEGVGYTLEGDIHAFKRDWNSAARAYRDGLMKTDTAELASRLHASLRAAGRMSEAERFAAARLKRSPDDLLFRSHLADSALAAREYQVAIEHYRALLAIRPTNAGWLNNLAWAAGRIGDPRAIGYAEKAVSLAPSNPSMLDTLGTLLVEKGETARGLDMLRKASSLAPESQSIRLNLAKALLSAGQKDAAKLELERLSKMGDRFGRQPEVERLLKDL
jgi:putative PEP-CTERM system TPR-repeat lipoprotein